jgi:hypothetical protein
MSTPTQEEVDRFVELAHRLGFHGTDGKPRADWQDYLTTADLRFLMQIAAAVLLERDAEHEAAKQWARQ